MMLLSKKVTKTRRCQFRGFSLFLLWEGGGRREKIGGTMKVMRRGMEHEQMMSRVKADELERQEDRKTLEEPERRRRSTRNLSLDESSIVGEERSELDRHPASFFPARRMLRKSSLLWSPTRRHLFQLSTAVHRSPPDLPSTQSSPLPTLSLCRDSFSLESFLRTPGSGQDHVRVLRAGSDGGDPSSVSLEGSLVDERFRHG